jgi:inositol 1,4,5-triphosphate receptor type 3
MLIEHSLLDGQLVEPNDMIRKIIRLCNETVILFVKDNEVNQNLAFKYFSWFLDRIDDKLGSSRVSKAIITGNRNLMKQCPKTILSDLMKNIVTRGRKPEYLDLLVGMTEIVDNGDSGVISLRHEISRSVTNRDRVKFLIEWCDASGTPGYEERKAAMAPFVGLTMPVSNLDLPEQLQYHINLLTLLSGLKLGQKLQAVYAIEDIIAAILDDNTIHNVKKCLGILLEELVENKIDGLDSSECIWEYFMYCEKMFDNLLTELPEFMSRDKFHLRFQKAEWIQSTLLVIIHFFDNFDFLVFRETAFDSESAFKVTPSSESDIQLVIFNLHHSMKSIKRIHSNRLGMNLTLAFEEAVSSLSHLIVQVSKEEETKTIPQGRRASLVGGKARATDNRGHGIGRADEIHEAYYRKQYLTFLEALHVNHEMSNLQAMKIFEKLPSIKDSGESDVRLEYFIVKISSHIRSQVTSSGSAKTMASEAVTSAKWVLDTWTHLIQKEFGQIALNDLADPQRIVELPPYTHFQEILNNCGATVLCLDLIAINMDPQLILGAMKLLVVLLSGSGGNSMVQQSIFEWLYETDSAMFFEQMKDLLEQQMMWCQRRAEMKATADRVDTLPDSILCLKVLSAMCDNFCLSNKNVVREQNGNSRFVNLLDSLAAYVDLLSRLEDHTCVKIASRVIHTILCFVQGPCKGNQEYFVLHTNLLSALNRIMRLTQSSIQIRPREWSDDIEILKEYAFELLHACIEGQHAGSVVLERVQVAMELNVLNVLIIPSELDEFGDVIELSELSDLQATYLVFLQNLSSNNKSIEIPLNAKRKIESDVARIEVIWNREVAVHYFNVPPIALDITGPSKDRLIEMVELSTQEAKLKDFLRRSKDLYREAVHFQRLKSLGIVDIWNFKHKLSWIMLFNVLIMNVLLVVYYTTDSVDEIYLPDDVNVVVYALNAFHIMFSLCTLITYLIVRVPVLYWSFREYGDGGLVAFFKAITDPMPLWYSVYLAVSVLSLLKNYLLLSFLLLDFIVMDSTSRDIMNAVIYPARQLATALIIIMIMVNMFSGAVFYYFRHDFDFDDVDGKSLFDTFKLLITFGVRANEGVGAYMTPNIHSRFILDMFFFLIIVVILMNIFFGIIIDTFGKLRNLKVDREADEANKCFICGVEEHYFLKHSSHDLDSSANEGFKYHRRVTHNMWNYLYFAMKIWQQPRDLDNSVEMHVRSCMERGDISWFPIGIFNTDTNNSSLAMIGDAGNAMAPSTKILALSDNGDGKAKGGVGGGLPSSPRKGNDSSGGNNSNNASLMQDFARLEETLNQKLNSLNENIATLTSFSVQNTLDENYAADAFGLDNRKSNRLSNANSVNSPRKRESSLNKSSKRESSSFNKITNVADTVRAAMAQAVFKRQLAQKHLAELEEEVKSPVKEGLSSQFVAPTHHEKTVLTVDTDPKDNDIIEIEEGAPPHSEKKMTISPSTRMMEMMRSCFQEELSPLKNQLTDLSVRVGHLEKRTEKEVLPQRRDSVNEEVEILIDHDLEKEKESTTPRKGSLKKSTIGDLAVKNHATPSKVHFKDTVIVTAKSSSDDSKRGLGKPKGLKGEIARLTNVGKEKGFLTKQDKKKLDTTTKLAHAYLDGSLPRVKTSPTTNQQSVPITNVSKMSSSSHSTVDRPRTSPSPTRKREIEKSKKVQEAFDELAIIKSVGLDELDCEEDFSAVLPHVQGNDITPQKDGDESVNDLKSGVLKEDEISEVRATSPADSD